MADDVIERLASKRISKGELQAAMEGDSSLIATVVGGLASPKAPVRYGCAKALMSLSAVRPDLLYPHWESFAELLGGRYRILTWSSIAIIANLSSVDAEGRFEALFDRYYALLGDGYMVTAANVAASSARVAKAKPHLADSIAERLLGVEGIATGPHMTEECKRVVAEAVVEALGSFYGLLSRAEKKKVVAFAERQRTSCRGSLARAAGLFLSSRSQEFER